MAPPFHPALLAGSFSPDASGAAPIPNAGGRAGRFSDFGKVLANVLTKLYLNAKRVFNVNANIVANDDRTVHTHTHTHTHYRNIATYGYV